MCAEVNARDILGMATTARTPSPLRLVANVIQTTAPDVLAQATTYLTRLSDIIRPKAAATTTTTTTTAVVVEPAAASSAANGVKSKGKSQKRKRSNRDDADAADGEEDDADSQPRAAKQPKRSKQHAASSPKKANPVSSTQRNHILQVNELVIGMLGDVSKSDVLTCTC